MHHPDGSAFHSSAATLHSLDRRAAAGALARTVASAIGSIALIIAAYYVAPLRAEPAGRVLLRIAGIAILLVIVLWHQLRRITKANHPGLRAIEALSVTIPLLVVLFASTYVVMSRWNPDSFNEALNRTSSLYFTMTTLATIGYGDIHAQTNAARVVVMIQMVFNVAILGVAVRLITTTAQRYALVRSEDDIAEEIAEEVDAGPEP